MTLKEDLENFIISYDHLWNNPELPEDIANIIHLDAKKLLVLIDKLGVE